MTDTEILIRPFTYSDVLVGRFVVLKEHVFLNNITLPTRIRRVTGESISPANGVPLIHVQYFSQRSLTMVILKSAVAGWITDEEASKILMWDILSK
jgi:hypothetical protein